MGRSRSLAREMYSVRPGYHAGMAKFKLGFRRKRKAPRLKQAPRRGVVQNRIDMSLWIGSAPPPDALDLVGSAVHAADASAPSFSSPSECCQERQKRREGPKLQISHDTCCFVSSRSNDLAELNLLIRFEAGYVTSSALAAERGMIRLKRGRDVVTRCNRGEHRAGLKSLNSSFFRGVQSHA